MEIIFKRTHNIVKKPYHINRNVLVLYAPRGVNIEPATSCKTDTVVIVLLPNNSHGFAASKFRGDEINKFNAKKNNVCG